MYRLAIISLSLTVLLFTSGYGAAYELSIRCKGTIDSFKGSLWTRENEEIGAHLVADKISFFGNSFLSGENVKICAGGEGEVYFDNDCNQTQAPEIRRSGIFDKLLLTLNLSNSGRNVGINGFFTCKEN